MIIIILVKKMLKNYINNRIFHNRLLYNSKTIKIRHMREMMQIIHWVIYFITSFLKYENELSSFTIAFLLCLTLL